jgi:hypothetical protein
MGVQTLQRVRMSDRVTTVDRRSGRHGSASRASVTCRGCGCELVGALMHDAKTTPGARWLPDGGAVATVPNAWALPGGPPDIGGSCPGATSECSGCYAVVLESAYTGFRDMLRANLDNVTHALNCGGVVGCAELLTAVVRRSVDLQRADGVRRPVFRWHADGDIMSMSYGRAMRRAILATPDVDHWAYTRTLSAVRLFDGVPSLRLYVSADRANLDRAADVARRWGRPLALLADDDADARRLWDRVGGSIPEPVTCPASDRWQRDGIGPAHIVGPDGRRSTLTRGGSAVGACVSCAVCLPGGRARSVTFLRHGSARDALGSVARVRIGGAR